MTRPTRRLLLPLALLALPLAAPASFVHREEARAFVQEMSNTHGFDDAELYAMLDRARHHPRVIELIRPPATTGTRSWQRYRARFLDNTRIDGGLAFWRAHRETIARASAQYGVPEEVIVAIIGVETLYGRHTGNFETFSALATLAFDYPPRAPLFRRELENLLLLAREQGSDPFSYYGSFAGAVGYPQFLPSSVRHYAVDFDGDGRIDFDHSPTDAIGSVANYLHVHGWQAGRPIAHRARIAADTDARALIDAGIDPSLTPDALLAAGVVQLDGSAPADTATFVDLPTPNADTEYWLGYRNFYVITRYNRSSFYAMAVFQLAEALRHGKGR